MVDYKLVKYCKLCKKRFVVDKNESRKFYCDKCQKIADKYDYAANNSIIIIINLVSCHFCIF